jgi:hypothetical protein
MKKFSISKIYLGLAAIAVLFVLISKMLSPDGSGFAGIGLMLLSLPWSILQVTVLDSLKIFPSATMNLLLSAVYVLINYKIITKFEK